MDKLPSKNHEKLLLRISNAPGGKIALSALGNEDRDRFSVLQNQDLVRLCDPYDPPNDPRSSVVFVGPFYRSAMLSTAGKDYLSDLKEERRDSWKRFGRDILMMILGALVTLLLTLLFNQLSV